MFFSFFKGFLGKFQYLKVSIFKFRPSGCVKFFWGGGVWGVGFLPEDHR